MASSSAPICPQCGQLDKVSKVSAVYREGRATVEAAGVGTASVATALATRLAPPPAAAAPGTKGGFVLAIVLLVIAAVEFIAGVANYEGFGVVFIVGAVVALIFAAALFWLESSGKAQASRQRRADARARWERAYYCERCDGTFVPGETGLTPLG